MRKTITENGIEYRLTGGTITSPTWLFPKNPKSATGANCAGIS